jgi:archaellum component FlaG (FlaF/FlaG flagellin family)
MSFQITDGKGSGRRVEVDGENRLTTVATTQTNDFHINQKNGKYWSCPFGPQDPDDVNDYVFYIKNTGDKDLGITDIRVSCTGAASQLQINSVTGTAIGGNTITPIPRSLGSSQVISGIVEEDTNITGLTSVGTLFYMEMTAVATLYHLKTSSNIIIPKGSAVGILVVVATSIVTGVISVIELE